MERDWARLGRALAEAREERALKQEEVADQLDIGRSTLQAIEHGRPRAKVTPTIRAYARLVGWTDESPERVLVGGTPTMRPEQATDTAAPALAAGRNEETEPLAAHDLSRRVLQALQEGPLLDSQIVTVETPGGEVRATIVVRGKPDASPEDLDKALLAWQEREERARRSFKEQTGSDDSSG
ncbi:helix-turn-helix transcriptional regulator [Streptomyces sp. DASNCL29]|uniref:helix-turn-helix domain-containing protein n=1 Tax=Streptomyces sp. DASNCL29 TaxID=2583819 RepID=UPI00110FC6C2|nr:helix-turn-helix transcriptional regulator [Streptomyces sp. DASNCL29]TMU98053.1 helix-turn-helix transcriptional regulator [Streptomyces sp. DASNCL29]